ncbi:DUF6271 family protein [Streptomyces sp. NPDC127098]|uniref:DUF6271 family protein n=1 Tax=Streptomyces sp. NPDC127098 TaxID=3347137 RepID=UPI00366212CB
MRRICLTLPTNRPCAAQVTALKAEAAYGAETFGAEVHVLILDSADEAARHDHARAVRAGGTPDGVVVRHLDEAAQRAALVDIIGRANAGAADRLLGLMLPRGVSYGACTNRAFLFAAALGCESVHRRDSDSGYQTWNGRTVFPLHHELAALGRRAGDVVATAARSTLRAADLGKPVSMVGGSFIGDYSVDIRDIRERDLGIYHEFVGLWAPSDWSAEQKRELAEQSFTGAGDESFTGDDTTLAHVDPMRVDMCNISFHGVHEDVPLPPATDTIGSDYFLIHLVHDSGLPGLLHNRHIVNAYTRERRTPAGFRAYQLRVVKFFLSMLYFNAIYARMAEAGGELLDEAHRARPALIARFARESAGLDRKANLERLEVLERCYRKLGGAHAELAGILASRRDALLDEAERDIRDFARLVDVWRPLVRAARAACPAELCG